MQGLWNPRIVRAARAVFVCLLVVSVAGALAAQTPRIQVAPSGLDFGEVYLGDTGIRTIELRNVGDALLQLTKLAVEGTGAADFSTPAVALPTSLAAGGRLTTQVRYTPDRRGPDQARLVVQSNDPDNPVINVSLAGRGEYAPIPRISVAPLEIDFGGTPVASASGRTVTIRNFGFGVLTITGLEFVQGMDQAYSVAGSASAPLELERNETVQFQVVYRPVNEGIDFARLEVRSDDAETPLVRVTLTGRGIPVTAPDMAVSPSSLDFGDVLVGVPRPLSLTIANVGLRQLQITRISIEEGSSPDFAISGGPVTANITTGGALAVEVVYTPSTESAHTGTLAIESNDAGDPLQTVALSGQGVLPMFRRGDANGDGEVDLSDAITVLGQLFGHVPAPLCLDASDSNDDATVDVSDAVFTLVWLFGEDLELPAPGAQLCGVDLTADEFATCMYPPDACE